MEGGEGNSLKKKTKPPKPKKTKKQEPQTIALTQDMTT